MGGGGTCSSLRPASCCPLTCVGQALRADAVTKASSDARSSARAQPGIRSNAGDPGTDVVDKGATTRDIIAAPEGDGQAARTSTPQ